MVVIHQNWALFVTACVFVATILDEIPMETKAVFKTIDINGESVLLMFIDPLDEIFSKKLAEEVVLK